MKRQKSFSAILTIWLQPKQRFMILVFVECILTNSVFAQEKTFANRFELSGSVSYKYTSDEGPLSPGQQSVLSKYAHKTISILPSIGYFISGNIEILVEPRYSVTIDKTRGVFYFPSEPVPYETTTRYRSGLSFGVYYQTFLFDNIAPFAGFRAGVNWSKISITQTGTIRITGRNKDQWSKPEVSFPNLAAGAKLFFIDDWALIVQIQYAKVRHRIEREVMDGSNLDVGLGFLVIL